MRLQMFPRSRPAGSFRLFERLKFLQGNWKLLALWPVVALLITGIGWSMLLSHLAAEKHATEEGALREAAAFARTYSEQQSRTLETVDQFALHVKQAWELSRGAFYLEGLSEDKAVSQHWPFNVMIYDRDGKLVSSKVPLSVTSTLRKNARDRPFFDTQRSADREFLYIGVPWSDPGTGDQMIHFTRRLADPHGGFDGIVLVTVPIQRFTTGYNDALLGQRGVMGLVGIDGVVRATRIGNEVQPLEQFAVKPAPILLTSPAGTQAIDGSWFSDRRPRFVSWKAVEPYRLVAVIGLDRAEKMTPYFVRRDEIMRGAWWATAILMLFKFIAMGLTMRLAWRKHQMEVVQTTYRLATEEGSEGFYIARPVHDPSGRIVDFMVMDCNQRGAAFFRLHREELVGQTVSSLYRDRSSERLMKALCAAVRRGSFEDEIEVQTKGLLTTGWLHLKIVYTNGDLAVRLRDISDTKAHIHELERRANEDVLTGLPNRQWVLTHLPKAIERAAENRQMLALLFLDLDGFKTINDTMGHSAGDELLKHAARRLQVAVRPEDHVARLGGDEFIVIVEGIQQHTDAGHVAERVLHSFNEGFQLTQGPAAIGSSIGISVYPRDGTDTEALLQHADIAMYAVKAAGKRGYRYYSVHLYDALKIRLEKEEELRQAIDGDQFVIHYQPRVDMADGNIVAMEALVRWEHPKRGLLLPNEFIALAEETRVISRLGEMVLDKVCAQIARWSQSGQQLVPVSVNVSPRQFNDTDVPAMFAAALERHACDPALIQIELTESLMMADTQEVDAAVSALQTMGIRLLVDDFGTGYSSLSQLQRLDFDILKVDKAFTADIDKSKEGNIFFTAIVTMAHALGMRVVAEGVENQRQVQILKALACDEIQGYYISKPKPPAPTQTCEPPEVFLI